MAVALADLERRLVENQGHRHPIDIEDLLQWAMAQSGYLPWRGVAHRELEFDWGYDALAAGCKTPFESRGILLRRALHDDANMVIDAITGLEPRSAHMVIACAREHKRPHWYPGVEPQRIAKQVRDRHKSRGRKRRIMREIYVWDVDPKRIELARQCYEAWHKALNSLALRLHGRLAHFHITGFSAPNRPWR